MIDNTKRNLLKSIAVAGSAAALPAWALSASASQTSSAINTGTLSESSLQGLSLSFTDSQHAGAQLVSLSNTTETDVTLRHIYPGIVSTGSKVYDLNDLLSNGELIIPKGATHVYRLNTVVSTISERELPVGLIQNTPVQVSTVMHGLDGAYAVTTTRSLLV